MKSFRNKKASIRKRIVLFMAVLCLFVPFLTSCIMKDGKIYGERAVLKYVRKICGESFELAEKELIAKTPDNMEYRFRTKKRGLSFKANSYLTPIKIDASKSIFYTREISCDYVSKVHELYEEELEQELTKNHHYLAEKGWLYVISFEDIQGVVDTVLAADEIYRQETEYNSPEFLEKNPLRKIRLVWRRSDEGAMAHNTWVNIGEVKITGQNKEEELFEKIANQYAQCYVNDEIENGASIPEEYLEGKHRSELPVIELNGREMLYDTKENPYGYYLLSTDDYKTCWYSDLKKSYMMTIDIGLITDNMSVPLIIREYVLALGGEYEVSFERNSYQSKWKIGEDEWTMSSKYSKNNIYKIKIKKNGKTLDIPYVTSKEETDVSASFCAGVTVEDFCRLFDLTYEVDETKGKIMFETR